MKQLCYTIAAALLFAACQNSRKVIPATLPEENIVNKYWKLIALNGRPIKMAQGQEQETHFTLRSDSTVTGHTGCNGIGGKYELHPGNRIHFKEMISTLRYCDEVPYESEFNQALLETSHYKSQHDTLWLDSGNGAPRAVFIAVYLR